LQLSGRHKRYFNINCKISPEPANLCKKPIQAHKNYRQQQSKKSTPQQKKRVIANSLFKDYRQEQPDTISINEIRFKTG